MNNIQPVSYTHLYAGDSTTLSLHFQSGALKVQGRLFADLLSSKYAREAFSSPPTTTLREKFTPCNPSTCQFSLYFLSDSLTPVSYTHLDVYKRQVAD